jgi:hypothetical protein
MTRIPSFDKHFDEHFNSIRKMQKRIFWMAPLWVLFVVVVNLGAFAAAVAIILGLLRCFGVI